MSRDSLFCRLIFGSPIFCSLIFGSLSFGSLVFFSVTLAMFAVPAAQAQDAPSEMVQVNPPPMRRAEPPAVSASAEELEERGDALRGEKAYLDALDYYRAALSKKLNSPQILNKLGIAELQLQRYNDAEKYFEHAVHFDHNYAEAVNNLGVIEYEKRKYGRAIKQYEKAIHLRPDSASFFSNLGAAYFSKRDFDKALETYTKAVELDPDVLDRTSHNGISAQLPSPEDRARYDYVIAKLFAKQNDRDRSLQYLRRALEEGYKEIGNVYKDPEFAGLRTDARFTQLMAARPPAIPE
jgi:tetratricopeptide (TPR) repeat protein